MAAWETRDGRGAYYTRSKRVGGRVVREYVGTGEVAELAAEIDAVERAEREEARAARRAEHAQAREVVEALSDLEAVTRQAVTETLHAEGFHRHKRQWRRRREAQQ
jgi:hypothetical protein